MILSTSFLLVEKWDNCLAHALKWLPALYTKLYSALSLHFSVFISFLIYTWSNFGPSEFLQWFKWNWNFPIVFQNMIWWKRIATNYVVVNASVSYSKPYEANFLIAFWRNWTRFDCVKLTHYKNIGEIPKG